MIILVILLQLSVIWVFSMLGRLLSKGGHGIFNMRNAFGACCAHEVETGTDECARVLTQDNLKTILHPVASRSRTLATDFTVQRVSQPATSSRPHECPFEIYLTQLCRG